MSTFSFINQGGVIAGQAAPGAAADALYTAPRKIRRGQRLAEFLAQRAMLTQPSSGLEAAGAIAQQLAGAYLHNRADRLDERNEQLRRDMLAANISQNLSLPTSRATETQGLERKRDQVNVDDAGTVVISAYGPNAQCSADPVPTCRVNGPTSDADGTGVWVRVVDPDTGLVRRTLRSANPSASNKIGKCIAARTKSGEYIANTAQCYYDDELIS